VSILTGGMNPVKSSLYSAKQVLVPNEGFFHKHRRKAQMFYKRFLQQTIAITLALFLLAGCGTTPPSPTQTVSAPSPTSVPATALSNVELTSTPIPYADVKKLFDYDASASLDIQEKSVEDRDGVTVHDIVFSGADGAPISAYLVVPPGSGPFAGILFLHWLEVPEGSRTEFLDEAVTLAAQGVVSILPQGEFPWTRNPQNAKDDTAAIVHEVISQRRAMDVLLAQPDVDAQRIAVVGHDFGAMYGGVLSGVDARAKTYVLMAGTPRFSDWFLIYWRVATSNEEREAYRVAMKPYDPVEHVRQAAPATIFFQFATKDKYIKKATANEFYEAASEPKRIEWYEADHGLNDQAREDRLMWLVEQLGLKP
jgi:cephalosporin-C deacetylase-like acetyl esterase